MQFTPIQAETLSQEKKQATAAQQIREILTDLKSEKKILRGTAKIDCEMKCCKHSTSQNNSPPEKNEEIGADNKL